MLKRVFAIDMERCPVCQRGTLRIIAAMPQASAIKKILRHVKLAVDPPPLRRPATPRLRGSLPALNVPPGADVRPFLGFFLPRLPSKLSQ